MPHLLFRPSPVSQITLPLTKSHIWFAVLVCLVLVLQRPASADTLYTYIGDDFSIFEFPVGFTTGPFTSTDHLFVSFTIAGPPLVCLTACSISATDLCVGIQNQHATPGCADLAKGMVQTDSSGKIIGWQFEACLFARDGECEDERISTLGGSFGSGDQAIQGEFFAQTDSQGSWTRNVPSPVPEPTTLLTCASGLVCVVGAVRRRRGT